MKLPDLSLSLVPEGPFLMGSSGRRDDETPEHRVFLSAFEMADTPVTRRDYALFLDATGEAPPPFWDEPAFSDPDLPVVGANWFEAVRFCEWLSLESGLVLRLPTEAEREKGSRGGAEGLDYPWGNDLRGGGHERIDGPLPGPLRVRSVPPNAYGLFHTADNVHEWCLDFYDETAYRDSLSANPIGPETGERRSSRGGSWRHQITVTRCAARSSIPPELHYTDYGFRWIRVL